MKRVAILISGSGSNMVTLVEAMQSGAAAGQPVLVLANRPNAGGIAKADALGVPTAIVNHKDFDDRTSFEAALTAQLSAVEPDLICLAGFMRILTPDFITRWAGKMINIHPSILPLFKGLHTHDRALEAGMAVHGCSVHGVTAELDGGPILGQAIVPILAGDTPETLSARVLIQEHKLYPAVLKNLCAERAEKIALSSI